MVGVRQRREMRMQLGEALILGALVMLVVMPIVYRVRSATMHVRGHHALLWPTAWMVVPIVVLVIGVAVVAVASRSGERSPRESRSDGPVLDLTAEAAPDDARTASRSPR